MSTLIRAANEPSGLELFVPQRDSKLSGAELARRVALMFGALSANSRRALTQDWRTVVAWCRARAQDYLPMQTITLEAFLRDQALRGKQVRVKGKPAPAGAPRGEKAPTVLRQVPKARATLARYVATIRRVHQRLGLRSPTADESWPDIWKSIATSHALKKPQKKAAGLRWEQIAGALAALPDTTKSRRDIALVMMMFDGLLRESEVCALRRETWESAADGGGTFIIPFSKTDQVGAGFATRVNIDTVARLNAWLERSPGREGPLFVAMPASARGLPRVRRDAALVPVSGDSKPLRVEDVDAIMRGIVKAAGLDPSRHSGHSARVGACQEMFKAGIPLSKIMDEGRWKSEAMPVRYAAGGEKVHGASADLAKKLGRG